MRLIPVGLTPSDWASGDWFEKPGCPQFDGSWVHAPLEGQILPEFVFLEDHERLQGEPSPVLYIGSGLDSHIQLDASRFPRRLCRFFKRKGIWIVEALLPRHPVHLNAQVLEVGKQETLQEGDVINVLPSMSACYIIETDGEKGNFSNRHPSRFPLRLGPRATYLCC